VTTPKTAPDSPNQPSPASHLQWFGWTDVGRVRKNNEDAFLGLRFDEHEVHLLGKFGEASLAEHDFTFAVCDGMGGAKAGEYASQIAVEKITRLLPQAMQNGTCGTSSAAAGVLTELYTQVHRALVYLGRSYDECHGMQTTMSLCWFTPDQLHFGHVGDTRIYHLPEAGKFRQLTEDDTYVGWLYRNGKLTDYEARTHPRRNVLQKSLGGENQFVTPQVGSVGFGPGDTFLLCTDGMSEGLYEHHILEILNTHKPGFNPAKALVESAVKGDGSDNATVMVVRVK